MRGVPLDRGAKDLSSLNVVKYGATGIAALMLIGIGLLMLISNGTGEDITGIVAPALLLTVTSSIAAIAAAVSQRRAQRRSESAR